MFEIEELLDGLETHLFREKKEEVHDKIKTICESVVSDHDGKIYIKFLHLKKNLENNKIDETHKLIMHEDDDETWEIYHNGNHYEDKSYEEALKYLEDAKDEFSSKCENHDEGFKVALEEIKKIKKTQTAGAKKKKRKVKSKTKSTRSMKRPKKSKNKSKSKTKSKTKSHHKKIKKMPWK